MSNRIALEGDCPNCKHNVKLEGDLPPVSKSARLSVTAGPDVVPLTELDAMVQKALEKAIPKQMEEKPSKKERELPPMPSFVPKFKCKNCKENHKNPGYTSKAKTKCATCGQFQGEAKGTCPWCGGKEWEDIDEDVLGMLDDIEAIEHEHEHES